MVVVVIGVVFYGVLVFVGIGVDEDDCVDDDGGGVLVADDGGEFTGGRFVFDAVVAMSVSLRLFLRSSINFFW